LQENKYYRLIKYMKNVFDIEEQLGQLAEGRVNPTYKTEIATLIILMGFLLRLSSFQQYRVYS